MAVKNRSQLFMFKEDEMDIRDQMAGTPTSADIQETGCPQGTVMSTAQEQLLWLSASEPGSPAEPQITCVVLDVPS